MVKVLLDNWQTQTIDIECLKVIDHEVQCSRRRSVSGRYVRADNTRQCLSIRIVGVVVVILTSEA